MATGIGLLAVVAIILLQAVSRGSATLIDGPTNKSIQVGDSLTIPCQAPTLSSTGAIIYSWLYNDTANLPTWAAACRPAHNGDICLSNAKIHYTGYFSCSAEDRNQNAHLGSQTGLIQVLDPIIFATRPQTQLIRLGSDATFSCTLNLQIGSAAQISWWRDTLIQTIRVPLGSRVSVAANNDLKINSVAEHDLGRYYCVATNQASSTNVSALLRGLNTGPPTITSLGGVTKDIVVGESLTIACTTSGRPTPIIITWYKDNAVIQLAPPRVSVQQDNSLKIASLRNTDSGAYYCTARNTLGMTRSLTTTLEGESVDPTATSTGSSGLTSTERTIVISACAGGGGLVLVVIVAVLLLRRPSKSGSTIQRTAARTIARDDVPAMTFSRTRSSMKESSATMVSKKSQRSSLEQRMSRSYSDQAMLISSNAPDGDIADLTG